MHFYKDCALFFTKTFSCGVTGSSTLKLDGTNYSSLQFKKKFVDLKDKLSSHVGMAEFYTKLESFSKIKTDNDSKKAVEELALGVYGFMVSGLRAQLQEKIQGDTSITKYSYNFANKIPIIDRGTNQRLMYDQVNKCIDVGTHYDSWLEYRSHQPKDIKEAMSMAVMVADIVFNPFEAMESTVSEANGQEILTINAHRMPQWRKNEIKNPKLPKEFVEFMRILFMDEDSIRYVMNWFYNMLMGRNGTILLLHGGRGVGKSTLAIIASKLVGELNMVKLPDGFFTSRFNGELKHKRLCYADELPIEREYIASWKSMPERTVTIEEKNGKPFMTENFTSFIVSNNEDMEVYMLQDERKFSIPYTRQSTDDGGKRIEQIYGEDRFSEFYSKIDGDPDFIANIGWWVINNGRWDTYGEMKPYKSEIFYQIVEKALTNWQRDLVGLIESREYHEIPFDSIRDTLKGTGRTKVEKFLNTYYDREGVQYAYITKEFGNDRLIVPNEKYRPIDIEDTNINEEETDFDKLEF